VILSSLLLVVTVVAHDAGYNTSLANHIARWLGGEGVPAQVVTPAQMPQRLANEKIAFLVGFGLPTQGEIATLQKFRARGGKLVVFHSNAPALASMMGVRPLGYANAPYPGAWSRMVFETGGRWKVGGGTKDDYTSTVQPSTFNLPPILQTSTVLNRIAPVKGRGQVIATWADRSGKSTGEAAWVQTDAGWWMSHVLLADGDEALKARLLAAMCGRIDPKLWNASTSAARAQAKSNALAAYAKQQRPRAGEIHATWDHSGCGLYAGDWPHTMRRLKAAHVTDLFVNIAGAGFAHYNSSVLPRTKTFAQEGDQLAKCLAAAKGTGIRVHAWVLCFTATRADPEVLAAFKKKGWLLPYQVQSPKSKVQRSLDLRPSTLDYSDYLDPANAAVRGRVLAAIDELQAKYPGLAGIHLDFVRYDHRTAKPRNAVQVISNFVADARRHVKRPMWLTAAVLGKYPTCVGSVGQDWDSWLNAQLVDYVVPMDYSNSTATFEGYVKQHAEKPTHARRTIAGIGVTANESRLDARQVIDQINVSRRYGLAGNALFDLDTTLDKDILPYLSMGAW